MSWRQIHDTVSISGSLARLSDFGERLYWRLLSQSDAWGRLVGDADKVIALCCPRLRVTEEQIDAAIAELVDVGRVIAYDVDGTRYLQLADFDKHQPMSARGRGTSKIPAPGTAQNCAVLHTTAQNCAPLHSTVLERERERESKEASRAPDAAAAAAVTAVLREIPKPGYEKVTEERVERVLAQYPDRDHLAEAHALVDWERYGAGRAKQTKDGVARLRNWLSRARPAQTQPAVAGAIVTSTGGSPVAYRDLDAEDDSW